MLECSKSTCRYFNNGFMNDLVQLVYWITTRYLYIYPWRVYYALLFTDQHIDKHYIVLFGTANGIWCDLRAMSCTRTEGLSNYHSRTVFVWYTSNRMVCSPMSCGGAILQIFVQDHYMQILICPQILNYIRCFANNYFP